MPTKGSRTPRESGREAVAVAVKPMAGATTDTVLTESFWFRPRDLRFAEEGLRGVRARSVVEGWCDVPVELAHARYARRTRHAVHEDNRRLTEDWETWAEQAVPLALTPVIRVDTRGPVDLPALVRAVPIGPNWSPCSTMPAQASAPANGTQGDSSEEPRQPARGPTHGGT